MTGPSARQGQAAVTALRKALVLAQKHFRSDFQMSVKSLEGDLVTEVDLLCEAMIINDLKRQFPDYCILSEESGTHFAAGPWKWVLDPLDGTNNYAYGLPLWGISLALCYENEPVFACIGDGPTGSITTAFKGSGVRINGSPVARPDEIASYPGSALWLGYNTDRTSRQVNAFSDLLFRHARRTFENWAPTVDVGLFLQAGIDVILAYQCSGGTELPAVLLILREAGASVVDIQGTEFSLGKIPDLFVAGQQKLVAQLLNDLPALVMDTDSSVTRSASPGDPTRVSIGVVEPGMSDGGLIVPGMTENSTATTSP